VNVRRFVCLAATLGFVAFVAACVIPPEGPPPVTGPQPGGYGPPPGQGGPIEAGCSFNATQLQGDPGATFQIACPPGCESTGNTWGTDVYTADSGICRAGIHAGAISPAGGLFTVQIQPGRAAYRGSARNGVQSSDYGNYPRSYAVFGGQPMAAQGYPPATAQPGPPGYPPQQQAPGYPPAAAPPQVIEAGCSYNATQIQDGVGSTHVVNCPAGCASQGNVWGTDVYTADSGICRAAVHAGLLSDAGGNVAVTVEPGRPAYRGTTRNGIQSSDYGNYPKSFRLQRP
jgi:hypothetical protein